MHTTDRARHIAQPRNRRALLAGGDEGVVRAFSLRDGGGCGEAQGAPVAAGASIHALASLGVGKAAAALDSGALLVLRAALTQPPASTDPPAQRKRRGSTSQAEGAGRGRAAPALDEVPRGAAQSLYDSRRLLLCLQLGAGRPHVKILDPHPEGVAPELQGRLPVRRDLGRAVADPFLLGWP